jgi:hypothetical protein
VAPSVPPGQQIIDDFIVGLNSLLRLIDLPEVTSIPEAHDIQQELDLRGITARLETILAGLQSGRRKAEAVQRRQNRRALREVSKRVH